MTRSPLDGTWLLATDPMNCGLREEWYLGSPRADARHAPVPGIIEDTFPRYDGVVWYWRDFDALVQHNGRTLLRFLAVEYLANVWVNGCHVGTHEGGNTPFALDVTEAIVAGSNRLALRVLHVGKSAIDGLDIASIPHGLRGLDASFPNWGGIWQSVELVAVPNVLISDVFAEPHWADGAVTCHIEITNAGAPARRHLTMTVWEDRGGRVVAETTLDAAAQSGITNIAARIAIPNSHAWSPADPFLYRLEVACTSGATCDHTSVRFGLREFTYADGYFRLNGKRFFPRSAHTIGVYPGGMQPRDPGLLRRELLVAKEAGFNMLRILGNCAIAPQLDMADDLGILIYQEHSASWAISDTDETASRHKRELFSVMRRDRNHPSVVIWGVLNEVMIFVPDGPLAANAIGILPALREIDPTRFVVLDSGRYTYARWHKAMFLTKPGIGNFALPYSTDWIDDIADIHTYGEFPSSKLFRDSLRFPPVEDRKAFQTEFGQNTCIDLEQGLRKFEQSGVPAGNEETAVWREITQRFLDDWDALRMDEVFPTPRHLWDADREAHKYKIREVWSLAQANPQQIGTNYTAFCDEMMNAEGVVDYFRDAKPALPVIRQMQQPLIWCLFASPCSIYSGHEISVEALLRNEDVLQAGSYPAEMILFGPAGIVWRKQADVVIPEASPNTPVVHPVFADTIRADFGPGDYELHVRLLVGADARMSLPLSIGAPQSALNLSGDISAVGLDASCLSFLAAHGLSDVPFDGQRTDVSVIVHDVWRTPGGAATVEQALSFAADGGTVIFMEVTGTEYPLGDRLAEAQNAQQHILRMLPGMETADLVWDTRNWFTGTTHYVRRHPVFDGLPTRCVLEDQPIYQGLYPMHSVAGSVGWEEITGAFSTGALPFGGTEHEGVPPYFHYWHAIDLATRNHGKGRLVYCTYQILEHLDNDPAAGTLLLNLIRTFTNH